MPSDTPKGLFDFAFFPNYNKSIEFLATKLADEEEWDFSDSKVKKFPILKNYLEHTFKKVNSEKKISFTTDNKHAAFNTGLVTENLEEIFAFFEEYKNPRKGFTSAFCFKAFLKKSNGEFLNYFSSNVPEIADYFDKPEDLIFNPKIELIPDIEHIIKDNITRFPTHLQISDGAEISRQLHGAIDEVKRKVKTNYKIAVPQYYKNKIQLLLPLCLTAGSNNPDLALVVHKVSEGIYTARTCLTLKMAYNNARLIVKPQSSWLKP
jgi:isocitrate dehydrogenase kinase/phosphatase